MFYFKNFMKIDNLYEHIRKASRALEKASEALMFKSLELHSKSTSGERNDSQGRSEIVINY